MAVRRKRDLSSNKNKNKKAKSKKHHPVKSPRSQKPKILKKTIGESGRRLENLVWGKMGKRKTEGRKPKSYKEPNLAESEDVAELECLSNFVEGSANVGRRCTHCGLEKTVQWRVGPLGPNTLCNACGVRYISGRLVPEYRPAASPTFMLTRHSNSHRKVLELRRQKEMMHQKQAVPPFPAEASQKQEHQLYGSRHSQELHPLPSSSTYPTESNNAEVTEANMQFYTLLDLAEEISSLPLEKDCELNREASPNLANREASPNLTDLVQTLNENVSDAEEVDSATQTDLEASPNLANREDSPNLTDLVQKSNKNVSDAEEVDSATQTDSEASPNLANREASPNLTDLVQKLNKNVSDAEQVDSATQTNLVAVAGYKVKAEIAPFLRKILSEHGDIASECILQTPETRAALLESVCMIYRELEPKFPNITSLEVNSIQARIKDLETVRLRVEWLDKRLEEVSKVKGLLDKSRSLEEARAKCTESIEREEKDLESLEAELPNLQQKIYSKKADLALLKTEAESIEAAFRTMAKMGALPEKSTVSYSRRTSGKKWSTPSSKVISRSDVQQPQQQSPIRLQTDNTYKFMTDSYQQLRESGHPQPDHDFAAYLKDQSCNPHSDSQSYNLQCNSPQPHSHPQSMSQNLQHRSSESNLHAHSNRLSKPQHSAQSNSEIEHDQNNEASSDDVNDMNTPEADYTPSNDRGTENQGTNVAKFSRERSQGLRGITKPLRGWGTGQKMMLQLNEKNRVIGKLNSLFGSQLGVLAKDGKKLPLIYTDWRAIPGIFKDKVWKEIKDNTNLHDDCEKPTMRRLSKLWRSWKGKVKESYFTPHKNDDDKLAQHPPDVRIEKDQWPILVRFWKSKADMRLCKENMINIIDREMETPTRHVQSYMPKFQKEAIDMAVRAQVEELVGNMRKKMTVELVERLSGVKQKSESGLRGHMAFAVPNGTQDVPESSSVQPPTSYFEDQQREIPYRDASSAEVERTKRRKKFY